jgi:hypothetical protein
MAERLKAIVVLGDQNAGKSTLVRQLSGVHKDKVISLATDDGDIDLRAVVSSVNEREDPPEPDHWAGEIREAAASPDGYSHILIPLRYESKGDNPPAEDYYRALARVADIQVLAYRTDQPRWVCHPVFRITGQRNHQARNVRRHLGWV